MLPVQLRQSVFIRVRNTGTRPLALFGAALSANQQSLLRVSLEDPGEPSWQALIDALRADKASVEFPHIGGLSEALVEAALRQYVRTGNQAGFVSTVLTTDGTVSNSSAEGNLGVLSVPVEAWRVGVAYQARASGILTATGEPQIDLRFRLGSTLVLATGYVSPLTQPTAAPWSFTATLVCRQVGVNGQLMVTGDANMAVAGLAAPLANPQTVPIDLRVPRNLFMTAQWDTADVGNIVILQNLVFGAL